MIIMNGNKQYFEEQHLFISGEDDYVHYRIPALAVSNKGTILAFCEARKFTGSDTDQIDLFVRRSIDCGNTFGDRQLVATKKDWVSGNPAPVVDKSTGIIWLMFCRNRIDGDERAISEGKAPRTVWITSSDDDGETWEKPREITPSVKRPNWSWYATGPCHGIQLESGRLVIPCDHRVLVDGSTETDPFHSHIVYSDDHGESWRIGGIADAGTNESTVLESDGGMLYLNCRNQFALPGGGNFRSVAWSADQGMSFFPIVHDAALPEPICQAAACRFTGRHMHDRNRVLFTNPTGEVDGNPARRDLTIRLSYDECRTWPVSRSIFSGNAAYSDLCVTDDLTICCFYERKDAESENSYLTFARFNIEWITSGEDSVSIEDLPEL